jgi:S1-C subfamily serine protease
MTMLHRRAVLMALAGGAFGPGLPRLARADLVEVIATVRPSVLPVGTYAATDNPRFGFRGSGFVVGDGSLLATNAHVLPPAGEGEGARRLAVAVRRTTGGPGSLAGGTAAGTAGSAAGGTAGSGPVAGATPAGPAGGGEAFELRFATLAAADRARDLALLRLEGTPLPPLVLEEPDRVREGQAIALMGFPIGGALGFAPVTHRGIVASITTIALPAATAAQLDPRAIARLRDGNFQVLQLDATAYPGNSGGPLLDAATGRVLGVVNMVLVKGSRESALSNPTGITYAIPVRHLRTLLEQARSLPPGSVPPAAPR